MKALALVGFCDLSSNQAEITKVVAAVSSRIAKALDPVADISLPPCISIVSYFARKSTSRRTVSIRMHGQLNTLIVRLDIVVPTENATPEEVLHRFLAAWSQMLRRLENYLQRKRLATTLVQKVVQSLSLPAV